MVSMPFENVHIENSVFVEIRLRKGSHKVLCSRMHLCHYRRNWSVMVEGNPNAMLGSVLFPTLLCALTLQKIQKESTLEVRCKNNSNKCVLFHSFTHSLIHPFTLQSDTPSLLSQSSPHTPLCHLDLLLL